ncbi:hypothetical protein OBBRIDRAFT_833123 [Obba rivulosa]|uniref:Uncharacterized protein n=1 Tax=Obba rivulosa TaxID=1052685 RepID=A0A8E2DNF3_9APHY|nr:hypothetical protein OBBRIDRAFT_833123 [Obba rivulosa]
MSEFKMLQAIGEGEATPEDIELDIVDKLRDLWTQGRVYYDGSTLIVKYLDMVHKLLSRILGSFLGTVKRTDGKEALFPMGSTDIPLSHGGVKQPDESFAIAPTGISSEPGSIVNANLVVEAQNTHIGAREAVVIQLSDALKVHQALVLDLKYGEWKQVIRVILERWQRGRVVPVRVEDIKRYQYRDSRGKMHPIKAGKVYGIDEDGTYYLRSSQDPDYTRCIVFGLPRPKNPEFCYRTKCERTASYELYGRNVNPKSKEMLVFTVGQLENTDDTAVLVKIPIAILSSKIAQATDVANERERVLLNADPSAVVKATCEELQDRVLKSGGKRTASEMSDDSEPPEMDELLQSTRHSSKRRV